MWVAKFKIDGSKALIGNIAKKHKISLSGYPFSSHETEKGLYVNFVAFLFGEEKNKKSFITELKKHPRTIQIEREKDFMILQLKEYLIHKSVYHHKIVHIEPIIIEEDGTEFWTLGSWNKKVLTDFIDVTEKIPGAEILKIFQKKITNFSILSIQPELTDKQKNAMELAIKNNYYKYPRKITIKDLAKIQGIAFSTFHAHLRKAEQKLLPFYFNKGK